MALGLFAGERVVAEPTAREALTVLSQQRGQPFADQVLHIVGIGGADQPQVWRVLVRDPYQAGAIRDFSIQGGRVVVDQYVPQEYHARVPQTVIKTEDIRKDSRDAFVAADAAANRAKVGFDTLDYELASSDPKIGPVWVVRVNDLRGNRVGEVAIGARNGDVLRAQWFAASDGSGRAAPATPGGGSFAPTSHAGAAPPQSPSAFGSPAPTPTPTSSGASGERIGQSMAQGWDATKDGVQRGGEAVKTGFVRAGTSVREFWRSLRRGWSSSNDAGSVYVPPGPAAPATGAGGTAPAPAPPSAAGGVTVDPVNGRYITPSPSY